MEFFNFFTDTIIGQAIGKLAFSAAEAGIKIGITSAFAPDPASILVNPQNRTLTGQGVQTSGANTQELVTGIAIVGGVLLLAILLTEKR